MQEERGTEFDGHTCSKDARRIGACNLGQATLEEDVQGEVAAARDCMQPTLLWRRPREQEWGHAALLKRGTSWGRHVGQRPEENAHVGGWESRQLWTPERSDRIFLWRRMASVCVWRWPLLPSS